MSNGHFNVVEYGYTGRLDEISRDVTNRDLASILKYIRAEKLAIASNPDRGTPSIARAVLTKYWQVPRTKFHREGIPGKTSFEFGSKLLYIPWSADAVERLKEQNNVKGLRLEHVTPIEAMWEKLGNLEAESETDEEWATDAQGYLRENFTLAVVTEEQALAIDAVGLKTQGFDRWPFLRYQEAANRIADRATKRGPLPKIDVNNFTLPGVVLEKFLEELIEKDERLEEA